MVFLTAHGGMLGPIATVFGHLMNGIYLGLENGEALDGLRDNVHLNELGQRRLANTFEKIYKEWQ